MGVSPRGVAAQRGRQSSAVSVGGVCCPIGRVFHRPDSGICRGQSPPDCPLRNRPPWFSLRSAEYVSNFRAAAFQGGEELACGGDPPRRAWLQQGPLGVRCRLASVTFPPAFRASSVRFVVSRAGVMGKLSAHPDSGSEGGWCFRTQVCGSPMRSRAGSEACGTSGHRINR